MMARSFTHMFFYLLIVPFGLTACTTQAWYDGMQLRAENQCDSQPPGAREDCLARLNKKTYDAYEKDRASQK